MKIKYLFIGLLSAVLLFGVFVAVKLYKLKQAVLAFEDKWEKREIVQRKRIGFTETLTVLPLVNWHKSDSVLKSEMGVSYLIKTDQETILFDLGQNKDQESPSPLEWNMKILKVSLDEIDKIFLSHSHFDHVGGRTFERLGSFSLGNTQVSLKDKKIYSPVDLKYPEAVVTTIREPKEIGPGIASLGPISRVLFIGNIEEQALIVNVKGKGLVIFSGCGHQTLSKIISRTKESFATPIYGIIGDLHYPIPDGRMSFMGLNLQRVFASGNGPLDQITEEDLNSDIELLKKENIQLFALGGHDSSDAVISRMEKIFGEKYKRVMIGSAIEVAK